MAFLGRGIVISKYIEKLIYINLILLIIALSICIIAPQITKSMLISDLGFTTSQYKWLFDLFLIVLVIFVFSQWYISFSQIEKKIITLPYFIIVISFIALFFYPKDIEYIIHRDITYVLGFGIIVLIITNEWLFRFKLYGFYLLWLLSLILIPTIRFNIPCFLFCIGYFVFLEIHYKNILQISKSHYNR